MPGLDGFATAARIKRLHQARDVPIIFLSVFGRTPEYAVLSRVVCELRAAADALTRAHQVGDDLSVGVLPPNACAR